jgi:hypothetical protein
LRTSHSSVSRSGLRTALACSGRDVYSRRPLSTGSGQLLSRRRCSQWSDERRRIWREIGSADAQTPARGGCEMVRWGEMTGPGQKLDQACAAFTRSSTRRCTRGSRAQRQPQTPIAALLLSGHRLTENGRRAARKVGVAAVDCGDRMLPAAERRGRQRCRAARERHCPQRVRTVEELNASGG